jgi:predicted DCC family thiol-disulfide oxidoreductase YuxK
LSGLVGLPVINQAAKTGYKIFARYRHLLPKRQEDCCHLPPRQKE